jgi:hypothetical protein
MPHQPGAAYRHTQRGYWHLLLNALGVLMMTLALLSSEPVPFRLLFVGMGTLFLIVGCSFHRLTVEDRGDRLGIRFGPIPLFRRSIRYGDIREVEVGRTLLLDGWGIHWSPRGGWVWNLWGRDCVVIRLRRGTLRVGTDEPELLANFLKQRIGRTG